MTAPVTPGDVLAGKYRVEHVLGQGGMGVVVAARHMQLDERVAIKFLLPAGIGDSRLVARFLREGRAAAKIRSEHVARVYDVGTLETGAPYLVMEYLDGSDLDAIVKRQGPLPVEAAVDYMLQACEALAEAHAAGIIHRDIKPANLFVSTRADGSHVVKVIDFGISKISAAPEAGLDLTKTAEVKGSPLFMSPEQITATRDADARSDVWSLGVALHNLLTGVHPFPAVSLTQLCGLILQGEPRRLRDLRPDAPASLEAAILRCLEKDPAKRFQDVAELAAALVDLGPPHGRVSADRIFRTLRGSGLSRGPAGGSMAATSQGLPERGGSSPGPYPLASTPPSTPNGMAPVPAQTGRPTGAGTTGGTTLPASKGSTGLVVVGIAAVATVAIAVALILILNRSAPEASSQAADPAALTAAPARSLEVGPPASSAEPPPVVAPSGPAQAPSSSAGAIETAVPGAQPAPSPAVGESPAPVKSAGPVRAPSGTSSPQKKPPPKKDLFDTTL